MYRCITCGDDARYTLQDARRHAKQGYRTQREAFFAGNLHSLQLISKEDDREACCETRATGR